MAKVFIEETTLTAIGDAIRGKTGKTELIDPVDMSTEISSIESGGADLPEEAFLISGDCSYRFAQGGWDWFVENYGNSITTKDITSTKYCFSKSRLSEIPFDFNAKTGNVEITRMFGDAENLTVIPKLNNFKPSAMDYLFSSCRRLRNLPEDIGEWFDWSALDGATTSYAGQQCYLFNNCNSLRSIPMSFLSHGNPSISVSYSYLYYGFTNCYALDELVNLPIPYTKATWTSSALSYTFNNCCRLKNLTFAMPDGAPYVMKWKGQTLDLTKSVGFTSNFAVILAGYNAGITADKEVKDDATYQALKNDPDWGTAKVEYSSYNHDSAVATINSLPDTSAYLASAGGTNTIKFTGAAGSATDGGAINTLTAEEIAVATAKGWTVTLS